MANELTQYTVPDVEKMANAIAKSNLFGIKTPEQAFALMLIAQAEGRHPVEAARDYNIIEGKPSKTAEAMLRDFLSQGGKVEWHTLTDTKADATFSHPAGGSLRIDWDMARAKAAGLGAKAMWSKYPRQMLRSRVISEGVRSVCPAATSGMYVPEEIKDFDDKPIKDITPKNDVVEELRAKMVEAEKAMENEKKPSLEDWEHDLLTAPTLDGLKHKFKECGKLFKSNADDFQRLWNAKEKRKGELATAPLGDDEIPEKVA